MEAVKNVIIGYRLTPIMKYKPGIFLYFRSSIKPGPVEIAR